MIRKAHSPVADTVYHKNIKITASWSKNISDTHTTGSFTIYRKHAMTKFGTIAEPLFSKVYYVSRFT
jgi:hypothetical protein